MSLANLSEGGVGDELAVAQRGVGLDNDALLGAEAEERVWIVPHTYVELNLVDSGHNGDSGLAEEAVEATDAVVTDTNSLCLALLVHVLVRLPLTEIFGASRSVALTFAAVAGPMKEDEVNIINSKV